MSDWDKKLDFSHMIGLHDSGFEGWDTIDEKAITVKIFYTVQSGKDQQHAMNVWVDDNNVGLFYSEVCYTEGGTPIVRAGDKVGVRFTFQKEADALAFKLKWI